jgi:hypothetical protein
MDNQIVPANSVTLAEIDESEDLGQYNKPTVSAFIAAQHGIVLSKGNRNLKFIVASLVKSGKTEAAAKDLVKLGRKAHDKHVAGYYKNIRAVNAVIAADPDYRQSMKVWRNKKGDLCANTMYRKAGVVSSATYEAMRDELAALKAIVKTLPAAPVKA